MDDRDSAPSMYPSDSFRTVEPGDFVPASIDVRSLIEDPALGMEVSVRAGRGGLDRPVRNSRVQKSGLALVGHFHGFEGWRIQIFGATEMSYLESLDPEARRRSCEGFARLRPCAIVVTRGSDPTAELIAACEATDTPLLVSPKRSSSTINALHALLDERLAPRTRIHGVLVSIFGVGVLLLGRSGIGKSECALDLVMRGHRLVADDVVDCTFRPQSTSLSPATTAVRGVVIGSPAALLEHHIEIRGLGILNVKDLFGVTSVAERCQLDLVVRLSDATDGSDAVDYDRLGLDERHHRILGVPIPEVTIPVRPGRDVSAIVQIAARNELLKRAGHHGARAFNDRLEQALRPSGGGGTTGLSAGSSWPGPLSRRRVPGGGG